MIRDKVLNTRVSKRLYDKISKKAQKNRVSVSNLIRNLVEDALELHEDFHEAVDKKIKKYFSESDENNILGFQQITLSKKSVCGNCGQTIAVTENVFLALLEDSSDRVLFCVTCKNKYEATPNN
jgi:hypothetical protein